MRWLADENFNNDILRGLFRRVPGIDLVRAQDVGLTETDDPLVLAWAAAENRVLLTHDVTTITRHAYDRIREDSRMPGVIEVPNYLEIGVVVDDIEIIDTCGTEHECEGQVRYLPLR